jgi:hypothetical protein
LDLTQLTIEKPLNAILQTLSIEFFDTLPLFYFFGFLKDYATSDFYYLNMHFYTIKVGKLKGSNLKKFIKNLQLSFKSKSAAKTIRIYKNELLSIKKLKEVDNMDIDDDNTLNNTTTLIDPATIENTKYLLLELRADPLKEKLEAVTYWSRLINEELYWRCRYEYENAVCNTLGGAYATLKRLWKSKDFAARQLFLAKKVGDERLAIKSRIFICLYYISTEQFQVAHDELNSIEKDARAIGDDQLVGLVEYARVKLEERKQEVAKNQLPNKEISKQITM